MKPERWVGTFEHMFWNTLAGIELSEAEVVRWESEDRNAYLMTVDELASGWFEEERHELPDLESMVPGPMLAVLLEHIDRRRLNGHDVVRLLKARARQMAHQSAGAMADCVELSYAAPGGPGSDVERLSAQFEHASDEMRAALTLSRRAAEYRLSAASDICERLPRVWKLLDRGGIDVAKARAFADGTCHVAEDVARAVVDELAETAPRLTVGQLRQRIRQLCLSADPEAAASRERTAHEDRRLVIEPTVSGTANLHLFGLMMDDARAIGRRVNSHMSSLRREDRSGRRHDQIRADIARDLLLGSDPTNRGRGTIDIRIPVAVLDGGGEPGHVGGFGPVTAETARRVFAAQPDARHQITVIDEHGRPTHIYTLSRYATQRIRQHLTALQPTCSFPGCIAPAEECDCDHLTAHSEGGETSTTNLGPKCDHDHALRDHGWAHDRIDERDRWTSPLGHTYVAEPNPP